MEVGTPLSSYVLNANTLYRVDFKSVRHQKNILIHEFQLIVAMFISDPRSNKSGEENFFCLTFFCSHKYPKIDNCFIFEQVQEMFLPIHKNYSTFYQKNRH